jgi:hypothetical protein
MHGKIAGDIGSLHSWVTGLAGPSSQVIKFGVATYFEGPRETYLLPWRYFYSETSS